jgi:CheY-like chemotaxis protein
MIAELTPALSGADQRLTGKTVLIVEDDELQRIAWSVALEHEGCTVHLTANGREAMKFLLASSLPDVILLDMLMPIQDGWRFLQQLKKEKRLAAIPVVIVTAMGAASQEWATSIGATGFLKKPIEEEDLIEMVRRCS